MRAGPLFVGATGGDYAQPSCRIAQTSFQIFVTCRTRSPSKSMTKTQSESTRFLVGDNVLVLDFDDETVPE